MTTPYEPQQIIAACKVYPLYGGLAAVARMLDALAADASLQRAVLYTLNMMDSRNLGWIACFMEYVG